MALVLETGAGLSDAETYASVSEADAYFALHGSPSEWTDATTAAKEVALRSAADYLDRMYGRRYVGSKLTVAQRLLWPRWAAEVDSIILDATLIPRQLKEATAEAALRHIRFGSDGLMPDISEPGIVTQETIEVGSLKTSTVWSSGRIQVKDLVTVRLLIAPLCAYGMSERA